MNRRDFFDPKSALLNPDLQSRFFAYSQVFAFIVFCVGLIPLLGWFFHIASLTQVMPSLPAIKPLIAISFVLMGLALLCSTYAKKRAVYLTKDLLAVVTIIVNCITFYEFALGRPLFLTTAVQQFFSLHDGSASILPPTSSLLFILSGFAILLIDTGKKRSVAQYLVLFGFIIILPSIIEHFYGIDFIYGFASHTKIALQETLALTLLYLGILFSRPASNFMSIFSSQSVGGYLIRRLLITALVLPLLLGGIAFIGNRLGWYDQEFRFLIYITAIIIIFAVIVWRNAQYIHSLDLERRRSEQFVYRLAAIVESSDDAIVGRDLKGTVTDWNRGAEELYGYKAAEIVGRPISLLFPRRAHEELHKFNSRMKAEKPVKEYEADRLTKDGSIIPVSVTASPIKNNQGKVIGVSTISRDISERRQIERQRELFISIASHELKTPVTSTKAYTQLLMKHFEKKKDEESLSYLKKMETQLNKLTELISYLLDVSTIQKGQLQLNTSTIDLEAIVEETIEELQRTTSHKIVQEGKITRKIVGDKSRLTQVLRNVLTNAIKYSPQAEKVIVSCASDKKQVKIAVTDFGIGIPKSEQTKVFDPLYRSRGAKKDNFSGLGLGLYITREIVKKHGGRIVLKSLVGKGTTITITLPVNRKRKNA